VPRGPAPHRLGRAVVALDPQERQPVRHGVVGERGEPIIRRRAAHAGYDPELVAQLGGHSLRAGFVTQAFRNGASAPEVLVPARYRHDWALFTDWCHASDHSPMPAAPETLALFLREHPAAATTQRRRVSAINTVHTRHGYSAPGRSEEVRRRLDTSRADRVDRLAETLLQQATELPTAGWPTGLFGRRDALLLVLAATGMRFTEATRLRRCDVIVDTGIVVATTREGERFCLTADPETCENPAVSIFRRWAEIHAFLDEHHSTDLLRQHLLESGDVVREPLTGRRGRQPLLVPIDRWGHLPYGESMTSQSVSALVRAYVSGHAPIRKALPMRQRKHDDASSSWIEPAIELDQSYYERGTAARRRDHDSFEGLGDVFDEIADRADALFDELLAVLDGL